MKKNMFGTNDVAPSGHSMIWCTYLIGLHPILGYVALSGQNAPNVIQLTLYNIIEAMKGFDLLSMGVADRLRQLSNKALKGRNRNLSRTSEDEGG